ncbi:hypothetical protein [Streptomyces sp. NPDC058770]|uniref:hypothetical protein n=1 Tax=unclassified Streptomyces TaxID=2593676 RepID=UPI0036BC28AE
MMSLPVACPLLNSVRWHGEAVSSDSLALSALEVEHNDELEVVPGIGLGARIYYGVALPKGYRKDCIRLRDAMVKYVRSADWQNDFE